MSIVRNVRFHFCTNCPCTKFRVFGYCTNCRGAIRLGLLYVTQENMSPQLTTNRKTAILDVAKCPKIMKSFSKNI